MVNSAKDLIVRSLPPPHPAAIRSNRQRLTIPRRESRWSTTAGADEKPYPPAPPPIPAPQRLALNKDLESGSFTPQPKPNLAPR